MNEFDKAIDFVLDIGRRAYFIERLDEVKSTDRKECGNCKFWMSRFECPSEYSKNGRPAGPSMSDIGCNKFSLEDYVKKLKEERFEKLKKDFPEFFKS